MLLGAGKITRAFSIYSGSEALVDRGITVLPLMTFWEQLKGETIFPR